MGLLAGDSDNVMVKSAGYDCDALGAVLLPVKCTVCVLTS